MAWQRPTQIVKHPPIKKNQKSRGSDLTQFTFRLYPSSRVILDKTLGLSVPQRLSFFKSVWLIWIFVAALALSLVAASRGCSQLRGMGFSRWWLPLFWRTGSRSTDSAVVAHGLSCWGVWSLPWLEIESMSPELAGEFLSSVSPGKSSVPHF